MSASNIQDMFVTTPLQKQIAAYERTCAVCEILQQICTFGSSGNEDIDREVKVLFDEAKLSRDKVWELVSKEIEIDGGVN